MPNAMLLPLAVLSAVAPLVSGHGYVGQWSTSNSGWETAQKAADVRAVAYRQGSSNTGWIGSLFQNTTSMICGALTTPFGNVTAPSGPFSDASAGAGRTLPVDVGGRVTLGLLGGPSLNWFHDIGHIQTYLGYCGPEPTACQNFDASTASWIKIQSALNALHALRRMYDLINWERGDQWSVRIPTNVATGSYIIRTELLAFGQASASEGGQDEYYPYCGQIYITNPNTVATPAGVSLPGAYQAQNINPASVQGPALIPGGESLNFRDGQNLTYWWPSLTYAPAGAWRNDSVRDIATTNVTGATATFTFNGTEVYLVSPLSNNRGAVTITLDSNTVATPSLFASTDTVDAGSIIWGVQNLTSGNHTVVLRNDNRDGSAISVQAFQFLPASGARYIPTFGGGGGGGSSSSSSSHKTPVGAIAGGVAGGVAVMALVFGLIMWRMRRKNRTGEDGRWGSNPQMQSVTAYPVAANAPMRRDSQDESRYTESRYSRATRPFSNVPYTESTDASSIATHDAGSRPLSQESFAQGRRTESTGQLFAPNSPGVGSANPHSPVSPAVPALPTHNEEEDHGIIEEGLVPVAGHSAGDTGTHHANDSDPEGWPAEKAAPPEYSRS